MSTLSNAIRTAVADVEAWFAHLEEKLGIKAPPHVEAAVANIKTQAKAVDPTQAAAPAAPAADPAKPV